ncbi:hypothetical protein V495_00866 [Pseudogymnoascus sp. VKM F-4514 (FW-929)]|nr:hypothetical protein V495_00866 [Pseudogymnoascus sp. VKM F-4514 (FW-929)]
MKSSGPNSGSIRAKDTDDKASSQATHHAPVYESILSSTAITDKEGLAEQMDDIAERQEFLDDSCPEDTTPDPHITSNRRQQVVMFFEEGVTVHETPFSKDVVNAQALRVADSGKALSATGGENFFLRDCFDMLVRTETAVVLINPVIK